MHGQRISQIRKIKYVFLVLFVFFSQVLAGEITLYWLKLKDGGYKVVGDLPRECKYTNAYLTDMPKKKIKRRRILPVKSLNAIVPVNKEPIMFNPMLFINPTAISSKEDIKEFLEYVDTVKEKDEKLKELYEKYYKSYIQSYPEDVARKKALLSLGKSVRYKPKKWIPPENLPKELNLLCGRKVFKAHLQVIENPIFVKNVKVKDRYIEIQFVDLNRKKDTGYELITVDPPLIKDEHKVNVLKTFVPSIWKRLSTYKYLYIGGFLYDTNGIIGQIDNETYFTPIIQDMPDRKTISSKIYFGFYLTDEMKKEISIYNLPDEDFSSTGSVVMAYYNHKKLGEVGGLKRKEIVFVFKIVSSNGDTGTPFEVKIKF